MEIPTPSSPPLPARVVHVAVGRSPEKSLGLLRWTFRTFGCREVVLVHVHQLSPTVPTPLGRLPVNKANEEVVSAYRRAEMRETEKMLSRYLDFCNKSQVHAKFFMIEAGHVQVGIVDLVTRHGIQKLVMGAMPDNWFKVKGSSNKITYAAKETPPFCEIWFVCKGKHLWTREATEAVDSFLPSFSPDQTVLPIRSRDTIQFSSVEVAVSSTDSSTTIHDMYQTNSPTSASSCDTESLCALVSERRFSMEISSKVEQESDGVYNQLQEAMQEIEKSKKKAFAEIAKRRKVESETSEAFNWVSICTCD